MLILSATRGCAVTLFRAAIQDGEPVIFPTDTIYGIGAPVISLVANQKIYDIKKRGRAVPMPVLIGCWEQFCQFAQPISADCEAWLQGVWSNPERPHTVVVKANRWIPDLYLKDGTIALRMVNTPYLAEAIAEVGAITATSVNISGKPPFNDPAEIAAEFGSMCKYMLWGEPVGGVASVIVDISGGERKVLR